MQSSQQYPQQQQPSNQQAYGGSRPGEHRGEGGYQDTYQSQPQYYRPNHHQESYQNNNYSQGGMEDNYYRGGDYQQQQRGGEDPYRGGEDPYRGGGGGGYGDRQPYHQQNHQSQYPPQQYQGSQRDYDRQPPRYQDRTFERDRPHQYNNGGRRGGSRERDYQSSSRPIIRKKQGDFYCSVCGELNFASRDKCRMCGKRKDQDLGEVKPSYKPGDWKCEKCETHNFASRKECFKCHEPNKAFTESGIEFNEGDWRCFDCGSHNFSNKDQCSKCGREKTKRREGDLDCPNCGKLNFSFRANCFQCKTSLNNPNANEKPQEFVKGRRERSRGGRPQDDFKSGDWSCKNCNFHNFASRTVCKDCGQRRQQ